MVDRTSGRFETIVGVPPFSRISWGAILAGTVLAFALQLLLNLAGLGLGLATVDISEGTESFADIGIGAGLWWGLSAIVSLIIGGWVAGRLAGVPIRITAALHGASVWALATLLTVLLATTTLSTAVSGAFGAVGQIGQATASAVTGLVTDETTGSPVLAGAREDVQQAGEQRQSVMRSIRQEAQQLFAQAVPRETRQEAAAAVEETARDVVRTPGDIGQDLNALLDQLFAQGGVFSEEERQQAINVIQQRLNVSDEEAQQIVQNWEERYQAAVSEVEEAIAQFREDAAQTAEQAVDAVGAAAGWTALALALGLVAAVIGGMLGKPEPWMLEAASEDEDRGTA